MAIKWALISFIAAALMLFGAMLSAAYFKQSDFDKKFLYQPEHVRRMSMCV